MSGASPRTGYRIVYVWDADYPWDIRTQKICAALSGRGHDVHIVARNREWRAPVERLPEGTVHRLTPWRAAGRALDGALSFPAFFNPRWVRRVASVVDETAADVVIVRDLPLCPTALHVGRRSRTPVILDMAENYAAMIQETWDAGRQKPWDVLVRNPRLVAAIEKWCLARVDATLVVVEESADRLRTLGVPSSRLAVVSNTPPAERARGAQPDRGRGGPLRVVYLGLMEIPRGVGDLIDATAILKQTGTPVEVTIIGGGRDEALLRERARAAGLEAPVIHFTGRLPNAEALRKVAEADVGVVPHHADEAWNTTIPNKLFDYMAAGLAVVSSDALPPKRILEETGAGVTYRSQDSESLAAALRALDDPDARVRMGKAGRDAVASGYNWERDTERLDAAVRAVVRAAEGSKA